MPEASPMATSVAIVTQFYPPGSGGAEMHSHRLAQCLIRKGHRVAVLTLYPEAGHPGHWTRDPSGVPVRLVRRLPPGRPRDILFAIATAWLLVTELRRYDCVHWTMVGLHVTIGLPVAHFMKIRNVVMFAGCGEATRLRATLAGRSLLLSMRRWANRIVVLNQLMMDEVEQVGLPRDRAVMFPCEVDAEQYFPPNPDQKASIRESLGFSLEDSIVVFAGRFVSEKSLPALIHAFAIVRRDVETAVLVLVGDGPLMPAVRKLVEELSLSTSVLFPGYLESVRVIAYLQVADVFTLVSESEGIPCALIEALAVGLPAVVTAIPAHTQVVQDGIHGLWATPGDPPSIASRLGMLLQDAEGRAKMGKNARELVLAKYSMNAMAAEYDAFFREVREEPA